jgi:hypothetical protein
MPASTIRRRRALLALIAAACVALPVSAAHALNVKAGEDRRSRRAGRRSVPARAHRRAQAASLPFESRREPVSLIH